MKRSRNKRLGRLAFFLPTMVLVGAVVYALLFSGVTADGTLVVQAQSSYGLSSKYISATATVGSRTATTPYDLSLSQGTYSVTFLQLKGYHTPPPRSVAVIGGQTSYAVGVYTPILDIIGVNPGGFNVTKADGIHDVTPYVWVNTGSESVQIKSSVFNVVISPGENYTRIFQSAGAYTVAMVGTNATQIVDVS